MEKPPLGLRPKFIWIEERIQEIKEAIARHNRTQGYQVPLEWLKELNDLGADILIWEEVLPNCESAHYSTEIVFQRAKGEKEIYAYGNDKQVCLFKAVNEYEAIKAARKFCQLRLNWTKGEATHLFLNDWVYEIYLDEEIHECKCKRFKYHDTIDYDPGIFPY